MVLFVFAISKLLPSSEIPKCVQSNHIDIKNILQAINGSRNVEKPSNHTMMRITKHLRDSLPIDLIFDNIIATLKHNISNIV